jgi:hypothetical protein
MFIGTQNLYHNEVKSGLVYLKIAYDHNGRLENYLGDHSVAFFLAQNRKERISQPMLMKKPSKLSKSRSKYKEEHINTTDNYSNIISDHHISNVNNHFPYHNYIHDENNQSILDQSLVYDNNNPMSKSNVFSINQSHEIFPTSPKIGMQQEYIFVNTKKKINFQEEYNLNPVNTVPLADRYGYQINQDYNDFDNYYPNNSTPNIKLFKFEDKKTDNPYNTYPNNIYGMSSGYYIPDSHKEFQENYNDYSYNPLYSEPVVKERAASNSKKDNSIGSLNELYQLYSQEKQKKKDEKGLNQLKDFKPNYQGETLRCFSGMKTKFETNEFLPNKTMPINNFELKNASDSFIHFKPESTQIYKYSFRTGKWTTLHNLNNFKFPRFHGLAEVNEDNIFITGGEYEDATLNSAIYYSDEMFIEVADMNKQRKGHSSIYFDGYVYVFGGFYDEKTIIRECERYNFKSKEWEQISNMIFTKAYSTPTVMNGSHIYLVGGFSSGKFEGVI